MKAIVNDYRNSLSDPMHSGRQIIKEIEGEFDIADSRSKECSKHISILITCIPFEENPAWEKAKTLNVLGKITSLYKPPCLNTADIKFEAEKTLVLGK